MRMILIAVALLLSGCGRHQFDYGHTAVDYVFRNDTAPKAEPK